MDDAQLPQGFEGRVEIGDVRLHEAWVRVAPMVIFGLRALPSRWHRFWMRALLGWRFYTAEEYRSGRAHPELVFDPSTGAVRPLAGGATGQVRETTPPKGHG